MNKELLKIELIKTFNRNQCFDDKLLEISEAYERHKKRAVNDPDIGKSLKFETRVHY